MAERRYDYVIVGAGTAGSVLAARLSEDPAIRVALIEAGPWNTHPFFHVPALVGAAIGRASTGWGFSTVPQPALDGRRIPLPRGRVVGGSGSINGMAYFRGQPADYDGWAADAPGWSWREVLPYFLRSEDNADHRNSPWHGTTGPIRVTHMPRVNPMNAAFLDAFAAHGGFPACADFSGEHAEGYGLRQGTIRRGRRDSSAAAFLWPARDRANLEVLTNRRVARVRVEGGRATGIECLTDGGGRETFRSLRETILCAGAFQSPQLLLLSGIGAPAAITPHGLRVVHELPGVGLGLQDHPAAALLMEMRDTSSYGLSFRTLPRALWNGAEYLFARRGPLASNLFESTAFIRSDPARPLPDLQVVFQPARRNRNRFPLPLGHGFAASAVNLYPRSRGTVRLESADPAASPLIDPALLQDPADFDAIVTGLELSRELFASAPFRRYAAREVSPGPAVRTREQLVAYIRATAATVHHPTSTCRMGSDADAVVDPQLRVRGLDGLRVVDASIFPSIVGGNTNAPVVMVAEKAADMILGRTPPAPHEATT